MSNESVNTPQKDPVSRSSVSGFESFSLENLSASFTDMTEIHTSAINVLVRAKRYGRWYMLKGLKKEVRKNQVYQAMLRKEFKILVETNHPHVVQVYSMEPVDGLGICIVMEWIEGSTLSHQLEMYLPQATKVRIADELLDAVAYIHSLGIIHRDLKPANVMLTRNGQNVKLIDFGLADTDSHTYLKQPAGTMSYMSEEQQQIPVPDVRNDVYSLGMILQKMELGFSYRRIISHCLLDIDHRYQDVYQLRQAIERQRTLYRWGLRVMGVVATVAVTIGGVLFIKDGADTAKSVQPIVAIADTANTPSTSQATDTLLEQLKAELDRKDQQIEQLRSEEEQTRNGQEEPRSDQSSEHVTHAIEVGKKKVDESALYWNISLLLDTLSRWEYHVYDLPARIVNVNKDTYKYLDDIKILYSEDEMDEIRNAVLTYWKAWDDKIALQIKAIKARE